MIVIYNLLTTENIPNSQQYFLPVLCFVQSQLQHLQSQALSAPHGVISQLSMFAGNLFPHIQLPSEISPYSFQTIHIYNDAFVWFVELCFFFPEFTGHWLGFCSALVLILVLIPWLYQFPITIWSHLQKYKIKNGTTANTLNYVPKASVIKNSQGDR